MVNSLTKYMAYDSYKFHICFFLSVLKKQQTDCTHASRHKDVKIKTTRGPRSDLLTTVVKISLTRAKQ